MAGDRGACGHCGRPDVLLWVIVPAELSCTGQARVKLAPVDACIAPIVEELNLSGVLTTNACCGHGRGPASIVLYGGRELVVAAGEATAPVPARYPGEAN